MNEITIHYRGIQIRPMINNYNQAIVDTQLSTIEKAYL